MFFFPRDILLPLLFTSSSPSYRIPDGDYTLLFLTRELNCAAFNFFFSCFITVRSLISSRSFSLPFLSNSFTHSLSLSIVHFFFYSRSTSRILPVYDVNTHWRITDHISIPFSRIYSARTPLLLVPPSSFASPLDSRKRLIVPPLCHRVDRRKKKEKKKKKKVETAPCKTEKKRREKERGGADSSQAWEENDRKSSIEDARDSNDDNFFRESYIYIYIYIDRSRTRLFLLFFFSPCI